MADFEDWDAPPEASARRGGRRTNPNINWALAEKLYVEGELVGEAEHVRRVYPGPTEIARRAGTTKSNLAGRIYRFDWRKKRATFQRANGIIPAIQGEVAATAPHAKPRRLKTRDPQEILLLYIDRFADALERDEVRVDNLADLDKAIRLLHFVRGQADSRHEHQHTVTLEVMQRRHRELRAQAIQLDDGVAGVLTQGTPLDAETGAPGGEADDGEAWDADPTEGAYAAE